MHGAWFCFFVVLSVAVLVLVIDSIAYSAAASVTVRCVERLGNVKGRSNVLD